MLLKRFLVILGPILIFLILEFSFLVNIKYIFLPFILALLVLVLLLKLFINEKFWTKDFLFLALLPCLLLISTSGFLLMISAGSSLRQIVMVIFLLILAIYLEGLFLFFYRPNLYKPYTLENLSSIFILLIFFLVVINLNSYIIFLNLKLWILSLILIAALSLILLQSFWINKIKSRLKYVYLLIIDVIIVEFFWALTFLPTNFYVNAIMLTIIFYCIWGLFKQKLLDKLDKKIILRYLLISSILLIVIIITSSWT